MERTILKRHLSKDLIQTIKKRNYRLDNFWQLLNLDVEIVGDMETPAVIKGDYCLACYVHNFNLIFTDHYHHGKELFRLKLQKEQEYDVQQINDWLENATHRRVYRIQMKDKPLKLIGYNFKNKPKRSNKEEQKNNEKYPVFGKFGAKVYFTKDYAEEIIDYYDLEYCEIY